MPGRNFKITQLFMVGFLCLLVGRGAWTQTPSKPPLSKIQVMKLLQGGVAMDRVAEIARERGIGFQVTPEIEKELRGAGATPELLETLRQLAPPPPKPEPALPTAPPAAPAPAQLQIEGAPKGAEIYVDDEFKGQVNREGRLKIPGLSPAKHVLRVSAEGFKEKVQTLELTTGETRTYTPNLVSAVQPPAALPGPKPLLATVGVSLFYESLGENAKLTLQVHSGDSPVLYVDVNGDGRIDRGDTAYGLTNDERPCTSYLLGPGKTTLCGTFHSRGTLQVENAGDSTRYLWSIPKSELSRDGESVQFVIGVYSITTRKWTAYPSEPFTNPVNIQLQ
ncbi:MAG: PEGA domain-containing protein [Terriglobia bacterium]